MQPKYPPPPLPSQPPQQKYGVVVHSIDRQLVELPADWPSVLETGSELLILHEERNPQSNLLWYSCLPLTSPQSDVAASNTPCLLPSSHVFIKRRTATNASSSSIASLNAAGHPPLRRPPSPPQEGLSSQRVLPSVPTSLPPAPQSQASDQQPLSVTTSTVLARVRTLEKKSRPVSPELTSPRDANQPAPSFGRSMSIESFYSGPSRSGMSLRSRPSLDEPTSAFSGSETFSKDPAKQPASRQKPPALSKSDMVGGVKSVNVIEMYRRMHADALASKHPLALARSLIAMTSNGEDAHLSPADFRKSFVFPSAGTLAAAVASSGMDTPTHLFFELKACVASICGPGETTELSFSLYSRSERKFISEDFTVQLTFNGMPVDEEKIGRLYTLFTDLSRRDLTSQIYLICRIVRNGRMNANERDGLSSSASAASAGTQDMSVRRPFGFAVLDISAVLARARPTSKGMPPSSDENGASFLSDSTEKKDAEEKEYLMRIYTPSNDISFSSLYEQIINNTGNYETSSRAETICISLKLCRGELKEVLEEDLVHLNSTPCITERMGFPDVILPGYVRNTIYVDLVAGEFLQGRKTSAKNIEVSVQARTSTGAILHKSISTGSGIDAVDTYESIVYYHSNSPRWMETVRVDIPVERFDRGTHLFLTFRHCSTNDRTLDKTEKAFAFAVLPLMRSDDTINRDGLHNLHLFKYDRKIAIPEVYGPILLAHVNFNGSGEEGVGQAPVSNSTLASPAAEPQLTAAFQNSKIVLTKDQFTVRTTLCSTKLTQDTSLLNLLRWKTLPENRLRSVLKDFTFVGPVEIIKYLQDIFNALFAILQLCSRSAVADDISDLTVCALSFILNMVISDRRFSSFRPILDVYVRNHFGKHENIDQVWMPLLNTMQMLASSPEDPTLGKELRRMLKAWEYLIKFVTNSWAYHIAVLNDYSAEENIFRASMVKLFDSIADNILQENAPLTDTINGRPISVSSLIGTQILVLQNVHHVLAELCRIPVFSKSHLVDVAIRFLELLPSSKRKVVETKLDLCLNLMRTDLFCSDDESNQRLTSCFCEIILLNISYGSETSLIDMSLSVVMDLTSGFLSKPCENWTNKYFSMLKVFEAVVHLAQRVYNEDSANPDVERLRSKSSIVIVSTLKLIGENSMRDVLQKTPALSVKLLEVFDAWLDDEATTVGWSYMLKFYCFEIMQCLIAFSNTAAENDIQQQKRIFILLLKLMIVLFERDQPIDQRYHIGFTPTSEIHKLASEKIHEIWSIIKPTVNDSSTEFVGPILKLSIVAFRSSNELQDEVLHILVDLLMLTDSRPAKKEKLGSPRVNTNGGNISPSANDVSLVDQQITLANLKEFVLQWTSVQVECIQCLDQLVMNEGRGDGDYRQWLVESLSKRLEEPKPLRFVYVMDEFVSLALGVRSTGKPDYHSEGISASANDTESVCLLSRLLQFTALLDQKHMYIKYVHQLIDLHLRSHRLSEAAWSLKLHADLYDWDHQTILPALDPSLVSFDSLRHALVLNDAGNNTSTNRSKKHASTASTEDTFEFLLSASEVDAIIVSQSAAERRELLYLTAVRLLINSRQYERAVYLCEKLDAVYRRVLFDFLRLANIHKAEAILYNLIVSTDRFYPEYYRIAFVGKGWSALGVQAVCLQNKQFICRSKDNQSLGEFVEVLKQQYPEAELMKSNTWPVDDSVSQSNKLWLQVCKVDPVPSKSTYPELFDERNSDVVSDRIREWYHKNDTKTYRFSRPFKKVVSSGRAFLGINEQNNEFLHLWTEEFTLTTENSLPSFLQCTEVKSFSRREISPIENAVKAIETKNRELLSLERHYRQFAPSDASDGLPHLNSPAVLSDNSHRFSKTSRVSTLSASNDKRKSGSTPSVNCNPFTMSINGAADAPVNGGIPMYRRAFLHPCYLQNNPNDKEWVDRLRDAIKNQVVILERCISLHELIVPAEMRPLHDTIVGFFRKNFAEEIKQLKA